MTTPNPSLVERLLARQCTATQSPTPKTAPSTTDPQAIDAEPSRVPTSREPKPPNNGDPTNTGLTTAAPANADPTNTAPTGPAPASPEPGNARSSLLGPADPESGNTGLVEPGLAKPAPASPEPGNARSSLLGPADPESGNTGLVEPGLAKPAPANPASGNARPSDLDPTDIGPSNPDPVNLGRNDPDPVVLAATDLTLADPKDAESKPAAPDSVAADLDRAGLGGRQTTVPDIVGRDSTDPSSLDAAGNTSSPRQSPRTEHAGSLLGTEPTRSESGEAHPPRARAAVTRPSQGEGAVAEAAGRGPVGRDLAGSDPDIIPTDRTEPGSPPASETARPEPATIRNASPHRTGRDLRLARAYLMRVAEPPAPALLAFVDAVGPVKAAAAVRATDAPPGVLAETSARRHLELAESDLADAERAGARLVVPEDEEWPAWPLLSLAAACDRGQRWAGAPLGLWARGPALLADTFERAVSVVGARSASGYGEYVATDVGHSLARAGMTVVSGAAYGIDGCAHRGALAAEGTTVAVLGCGVDVNYPTGHANLIDRIARDGLILSEYPPGTPPARHRFLVRNRLIAALSSGTVVVEAGIRSGARNTATTAAALGKVVLAVPGPITSATSAGCHDLLRTGTAMLAGSVAEILEAVGPVGEHLVEPESGPTRRTDGLAGDALRVHEALRRRAARTPARIAVDSGVPVDRVRALLPELELTGLAERCEEGWRQAPEP